MAGGLLLAFVLACSGWYITSSKLENYEASDIKYRYLKQKSPAFLLQWLQQIDSLEQSNYHIKDSVLQWEADEKRYADLYRQLQQNTGEGSSLKKELETMEQQNRNRKKVR